MSSRRLLATITLVIALLATACSGGAGESTPVAPSSSTSVGPRSDEPTASQPSSSPPPTTVATTDPSPWLEPVAAWQADNDVVGASVLVVDQTGKLSQVVVGFTDIQAQDPTEPQDRFRIGSITKVYTAALVLALAEDGLLDLDDSASAFVPALPEEITIGQLLSHTSGLRDVDVATGIFQAIEAGGLPEPSGDAVLETLDRGLAFEPGTRQAYSSVGFIAIERVIETVTGQAWDIVLAERILATGSGTELEQPDSGIPTPYERLGPASPPISLAGLPTEDFARGAGAAGGLVASAADVAEFVRALFGAQLLSEEALAEMTDRRAPRSEYGLGLAIYDLGGLTAYGHNGRTIGFASSVRHDPVSNITVVVLSNDGGAPTDELADELLSSAVNGR